MNFQKLIFWDEYYFCLTLFYVVLSPLYWNAIGRIEYSTKYISKIIGDSLRAVYVFGVSIFLISSVRDWIFKLAIQNQPTAPFLNNYIVHSLGYLSLTVGLVLVLSSYYRLGFVNTFLGDYFGFLLTEKIETFPFSVVNNPMYWGSFLNFIGVALVHSSLAGIVLSLWVWIVYRVAIIFEEPFTEYIYSRKGLTHANGSVHHLKQEMNGIRVRGNGLKMS